MHLSLSHCFLFFCSWWIIHDNGFWENMQQRCNNRVIKWSGPPRIKQQKNLETRHEGKTRQNRKMEEFYEPNSAALISFARFIDMAGIYIYCESQSYLSIIVYFSFEIRTYSITMFFGLFHNSSIKKLLIKLTDESQKINCSSFFRKYHH